MGQKPRLCEECGAAAPPTFLSKVVTTDTQLDINVEKLLLDRGCLTAPAATLTLPRTLSVESERIPRYTIR